jgi:hypothetical protein
MAPKNIPSISFAIESFTINDESVEVIENDVTKGSIIIDELHQGSEF